MSSTSETPLRWIVSPPEPDNVSALATLYVKCLVQVEKNGVNYDPTGDAVKFAFTPHAYPATEPAVGAWVVGVWEHASPYQSAMCLVGVGGVITLPQNSYDVWVDVVDNPELVMTVAGRLEVGP